MMRSIYHKELDPLESLEGPPRGPQKYEIFEKKKVFALLCVLGPQEHFSKKNICMTIPTPTPGTSNIQIIFFALLCVLGPQEHFLKKKKKYDPPHPPPPQLPTCNYPVST